MPPKNDALRYDDGKVRLELIPPEWLWGLGLVLTKGAEKYAPRNWEKGMDHGRVVGSLLRHLTQYQAGERYDKETGCHHLAMAAWNCLALMTYDIRAVGNNDLPQCSVETLEKVNGKSSDKPSGRRNSK